MDPISSPISKLSSGPRAHLRKSGSTILGMLRGSAATACTPTAAVPLSPRFPAAFALAPAAPALPAMTTAPPSSLCQNYYPECEAAINNQIVLELYTSYVYESMASYFSSHEVALKHFARFFLQQSSRGREHAERLMELQTQRGGRLRLRNTSRRDRNRWENGLKAMECALHLEMSVNQSLLDLHQLATEKKDAHLCDYLERHYLHEHVKSIKGLWGHITNLRKMGAPGSGLADCLFEKLILGDSDKKN